MLAHLKPDCIRKDLTVVVDRPPLKTKVLILPHCPSKNQVPRTSLVASDFYQAALDRFCVGLIAFPRRNLAAQGLGLGVSSGVKDFFVI